MTRFYGWRCAGCRQPLDHQLALFGTCSSCCMSVELADWGPVDGGAAREAVPHPAAATRPALSGGVRRLATSANAAIGTSNTPVSTPRMIVADREVS